MLHGCQPWMQLGLPVHIRAPAAAAGLTHAPIGVPGKSPDKVW
jgi:hypothetical protein